jgi:hypothetical protein
MREDRKLVMQVQKRHLRFAFKCQKTGRSGDWRRRVGDGEVRQSAAGLSDYRLEQRRSEESVSVGAVCWSRGSSRGIDARPESLVKKGIHLCWRGGAALV